MIWLCIIYKFLWMLSHKSCLELSSSFLTEILYWTCWFISDCLFSFSYDYSVLTDHIYTFSSFSFCKSMSFIFASSNYRLTWVLSLQALSSSASRLLNCVSLACNCFSIPAVISCIWILVSHAKQMRPVRTSSDLGKGSCRDTQGTQPQRAQNSHWLCFFGVSLQQWHSTSFSGRFYLPAKAWGSLRSNMGSI